MVWSPYRRLLSCLHVDLSWSRLQVPQTCDVDPDPMRPTGRDEVRDPDLEEWALERGMTVPEDCEE